MRLNKLEKSATSNYLAGTHARARTPSEESRAVRTRWYRTVSRGDSKRAAICACNISRLSTVGGSNERSDERGFESCMAGAEHAILYQMIKDGTLAALVDVLVLECHFSGCEALRRAVRKAAPSLTLLAEGSGGYDGFDAYSRVPPPIELARLVRACDVAET